MGDIKLALEEVTGEVVVAEGKKKSQKKAE